MQNIALIVVKEILNWRSTLQNAQNNLGIMLIKMNIVLVYLVLNRYLPDVKK